VVEGLYEEYQQSLQLLGEVEQIEPILRRFEWQLLVLMGHGFDWHRDTEQQTIVAERVYDFIPAAGFKPVQEITQNSMQGTDIKLMAAFELHDQRLLNLFKRIMRRALQPYLGEQPLRSRQLFTQFKETK
jgi:DNA repair protein RecO (recombination protein O)